MVADSSVIVAAHIFQMSEVGSSFTSVNSTPDDISKMSLIEAPS
jgi:hypothetical protein